MDYIEVVRNINQAYWQALLEYDEHAQAVASQLAEQMGLDPTAAKTMIEESSLKPLNEWLAQRSAAS